MGGNQGGKAPGNGMLSLLYLAYFVAAIEAPLHARERLRMATVRTDPCWKAMGRRNRLLASALLADHRGSPGAGKTSTGRLPDIEYGTTTSSAKGSPAYILRYERHATTGRMISRRSSGSTMGRRRRIPWIATAGFGTTMPT